jgi:hypothetical protein
MPSILSNVEIRPHGFTTPRFHASRHYGHLGIKNAIRPTALGKKNFLFIGHPAAGWRSAVIYSVLGSCRRLGIDPHEYLRDVLRRLPDMKITEIEQITPGAWAKAKKSAARSKKAA